MKKNIIVTFGGKSCEHDISVITGVQSCYSLDAEKYNIIPIYIDKNNAWHLGKTELKKNNDCLKKVFMIAGSNWLYKKTIFGIKKICKVDCAVICNHGLNGEDGTLQGLMELCSVPFTSSGVLGSAITMDKSIMKRLFEFAGLPVIKYNVIKKSGWEENKKEILADTVKNLKFPIIIKPCNLGSSIGITIAKNTSQLIKAIEIAFEYDTKILAEKVILNLQEINCGVRGNSEEIECSTLEQPVSWHEYLNFEDKYLTFSKSQKSKKPLSLTREQKKIIYNYSKIAFEELCCKGVVRMDFIIDKQTKEIFINEINSVPGSLSTYLWEERPKVFYDKLIALAEKEYIQKQSCKFSYNSSALEMASSLKLKSK